MRAVNINRKTLSTMIAYASVTAFCVLFSVVYEYFSHEVYTPFMYLAFLIPLIGGVLPYFIIGVSGLAYPARISAILHAFGIATLTVGSIMQGALVIYGTTNRLMIIYLIAGSAFTILGAISYLLALIAFKVSRS